MRNMAPSMTDNSGYIMRIAAMGTAKRINLMSGVCFRAQQTFPRITALDAQSSQDY
jgi:hypothetical protein